MTALEATLARPGVRGAALAYYRALFDPLSRAARQSQRLAFGRVPVPTLALTGADDGCIDTRLFDVAMAPADFPAGLRVERLAGCGHFLHLERPDPVHRLILDWIGGGAQNGAS
jgi:pimeloyl-ACP methyl ester carboxylesterase